APKTADRRRTRGRNQALRAQASRGRDHNSEREKLMSNGLMAITAEAQRDLQARLHELKSNPELLAWATAQHATSVANRAQARLSKAAPVAPRAEAKVKAPTPPLATPSDGGPKNYASTVWTNHATAAQPQKKEPMKTDEKEVDGEHETVDC